MTRNRVGLKNASKIAQSHFPTHPILMSEVNNSFFCARCYDTYGKFPREHTRQFYLAREKGVFALQFTITFSKKKATCENLCFRSYLVPINNLAS